MKKGGTGGANTKTGLLFEDKADVCASLSKIDGYTIFKNKRMSNKGTFANDIMYNGKLVAQSFPKNTLGCQHFKL